MKRIRKKVNKKSIGDWKRSGLFYYFVNARLEAKSVGHVFRIHYLHVPEFLERRKITRCEPQQSLCILLTVIIIIIVNRTRSSSSSRNCVLL